MFQLVDIVLPMGLQSPSAPLVLPSALPLRSLGSVWWLDVRFCICVAQVLVKHKSEWLRSKTQVTGDAGKDGEKEEHSSIAGGIVNLHDHSGNQSASSSENWK